MAILAEYHRPFTIDEAIRLLSRRESYLVPLAGGAQLVGQLETRARPEVDGVVDLRELDLAYVSVAGNQAHIGATTTLAEIINHPATGDLAGGLLRTVAYGEGPLNFRNAATVGGVVAVAASDSEFYAALLAMDAIVVIRNADGENAVPLAELPGRAALARSLITELRLPLRELRSGHARVARTPSDRPIVAAVAVAGLESSQDIRIALCGVASRPVLDGAEFNPPDDFKGSAHYRRVMAPMIMSRALSQIQAPA